ncbi:MAG: PQQ-dependent sugar dehydrogenase [Gammaproteobacteria bacterium]|nr:PQQ-dependent sugar dehydrogenase [Gammaproteobacteria bacterium]
MLLIQRILLVSLLVCGSAYGGTPQQSNPVDSLAFAENNDGLVLPQGFRAVVVSEKLKARPARHIAVRSNGDIYVKINTRNADTGIAALRDLNGDGKADTINYFGNYAGTGIAIHNNDLFASSDTEIFRYSFQDEKALLPGTNPATVVSGFPEQAGHSAKGFVFGDDGYLYVGVGAPSNACMVKQRTVGSIGMEPCPQLTSQGGVWHFSGDKLNQTQSKDGARYATGIRNTLALDWNAQADSLYVMQHGRDQLSMFWPKFFDDKMNAELPAEELLQVNQNDDFGWPYCYFDHLQQRKVLGPEYGGDGKKVGRCNKKKNPVIGFPGHLAPNDLLFYTGKQFPEKYHHGAFIAFHGSWNRAPLEQKGYFVVFVPFRKGVATGQWEVFADNFAGKERFVNVGEARHRPMGLAQGPDGSLYVTDSVEGRVWRIVYVGQ